MSDLPEGWAVATIGEMIAPTGVFRDGDWVESRDQDPAGDVRLIQLADVGDGEYLNKSSRFLTSKKAVELKCTFLEPGDVLIARMPDPLGRACFFPGDAKRSVTVVDVCVVRTNSDIDHRWLMWAVNSPQFRGTVASLQSGSTRKRISRGNLATLSLPVPPANEQRRVAAEIELQVSRLDAAVAAIESAKDGLVRYRASVLKDACEGRLVPTEASLARYKGRTYETANKLLERILEARRSQSNGKGKGRYKEPSPPDATDLSEIPEGWVWANVDQLAEVGTGATPRRSRSDYYDSGTVPWVTSAVVNEPYVDAASEFVTDRALKETNLTLYPAGTLLVAMYGEGKTRGKCAELRIAATTNQALAALQTERTIRDYLRLFLSHNYEDTRRVASGGVQPNLNLGLIRSICIPLPPVAEQHRIVAEVDRYLSIANGVSVTIDAALRRTARLRQAILKRAFEGKLVPQDPSDEPASVLLERIRKEREAAANEMSSKPKRRRTAARTRKVRV